MTTILNTCEQFAQDNRGRQYNDIREALLMLDWDGLYPVVDSSGVLTGETVLADDSRRYSICDVSPNGTVRIGDHCCDAVTLDAE